ncbi:globin family protein [soil metagenome]
MNNTEISLVQSSFAKVAPEALQVATLFYARLFELDPSLRKLFPADLTEQGAKLMAMLGTVVRGLGHLDAIVPAAQALGRRHVGYGVQDSHYATVGAALIDTLRTGLGADFTAEVEGAWVTAYVTLSEVMIEAARTANATN